MSVTFLQSIFDNELRHPNWFDRRILTGTDLQDEQEAHVHRARYLGQGIGSGVVYGLDVSANGNQLAITKGLAISLGGDVLNIPADLSLKLVVEKQVLDSTGTIFEPCDIADTITLNSIQSDYYILALTTASQPSQELAPTSTLNGDDQRACVYRYTEVGVQFKLISLGGVFTPFTGATALNRNRNKLAVDCFGLNQITGQATDPIGMPPTYGLLDTLRNRGDLTDCDVPIAALRFNNNTVQFVDMWSARRPVIPAQRRETYPLVIGGFLEALTQFSSPRRAIEGMATLLQFQDHLEDIRSAAVRADNYFLFLPAAGYLPVGTSASSFTIAKFFQSLDYQIQEAKLDPAYLRQIFHDSFYVDAIQVGKDPIDVYHVEGAPPQPDYCIFLRRPRVTVIETDEAPVDDNTEVITNGKLNISVVDERGLPIDSTSILNIIATNSKGKAFYAQPIGKGKYGLTYTKYEAAQSGRKAVNGAQNVYAKYGGYYTEAANDYPYAVFEQPENYLNDFWVINNLPPGQYSVKANPKILNAHGVSKSITIPNGGSISTTLVIRPFKIGKVPDYEYIPPDDFVFPDGLKPDRWKYVPDWKDILDKRDPGWIDPVPDDWRIIDDLIDPRAGLEAEIWLSSTPGLDTRIVTEAPEIWVKNNYDPNTVSDTVDAVIRTKDGSTFPLVMVASDNALDSSTPLTRTGMLDFDAGTFQKLESAGLGDLDVLASAPASLVAAVLGQNNTGYANALLGSTRGTLREDFQDGFMGYAGISKETSDTLKQTFSSKVGLANASADQLANILGGDTGGFASRLLLEVQGSVPMNSYSLGALDIGVSTQGKLAEAGVTTIGGLLNLANTNEAALMDALGTNNIESIVDRGLLIVAKSEFDTSPRKSIAGLDSVDRELGAALVGLGMTEAKELANSDSKALADATGVPEETISIAIKEATKASHGFSTLVSGVSGRAVSDDVAINSGFGTIGSLAGGNTNTISSGIGISVGEAEKLNLFAGEILGGSGAIFRGMR